MAELEGMIRLFDSKSNEALVVPLLLTCWEAVQG